MRRINCLLIFLLLSGSLPLIGQVILDSKAISYTSLAEAKKTPNTVFMLDLSHQNLIKIPEEIKVMVNLTVLVLNGNSISDIPEFLKIIPLHKLDLSYNKLNDNSRFNNLPGNIEELYLNNNQLEHLEYSITNLPNINTLNVASNKLITLKEPFAKNLAVLRLDNNQISTISDSAFLNCKNLRLLKLSSNKLTQIPLLINCESLKDIDLCANKIHITGQLDLPSKLEYFYFDYNKFQDSTKVNELLSKYTHLIKLSLENTNIKTFPTCLLSLKRLEKASLINNDIKYFNPNNQWNSAIFYLQNNPLCNIPGNTKKKYCK